MTTPSDSTGLVPGQGTALVGRSSFALMGAAPSSLIDELWPLVDSGSDIDALLEAVSAEGLRTLGAFALARIEPGGVRILVRGDAAAALRTPAGQRTFDARGVRTWAEHFVDEATSFELRLGNAAGGDGHYHLERGVVPASAILWPYVPSVASSEGSPVEWAHDLADDDTSAEAVAAQHTGSTDHPTDLAESAQDGRDSFEEPAVQTPDPDESDVGPVEEASGETVHISRFADDNDTAATTSDSYEAAEPVASDDYDALYGHTIHRSVQQAAVEDEHVPDSDVASGDPLPSGQVESGAAPAEQVTPDPPPSTAGETPASGIISGVPITGVPGAPSPVSASPVAAPTVGVDEGDHDGLTISAAQLRAIRGGAGHGSPAPVGALGGPTVQAMVCRSGHPNPPQRSSCRICSDALDGTPQIVPRPSMGRIVMSTGDVIELVRPAVVGRNPKVEGRLLSEVPQTVKLDVGQALSRSHAMIRLEGWQVLVEDLGSANGTLVTLPGRPPQRLHAGEPVLLEPGATIDLGGEITGTYDAGV